MAFIGNTPTTQSFTPATDVFSGNGSTTSFTLSRAVASVAQIEALIENVQQSPVDAYTVSGNTITFTSAPPSGTNNIYVRYTSLITQTMQPTDGTVGFRQLNSDIQGSIYGFKNRIINGAMSVWQRGTSFASGTAAFTYTADRFFVYATGASVAVAQVSGSAGYKYALQITGAASNTTAAMYQRIEALNCIDLSGATVTISVTLKASSTQTVGWSLQFPTASDNYASSTIITGGTWTVGTTATTYTATVTNLPAGVLNGMQLIIGANNFGAFTSGTLQITGVQLEKGSTATSFDFRSIGTEYALAQRYYCQGAYCSLHPNATTAFGTAARNTLYIPPPRTTPTCTVTMSNVTSPTATPYLDTSGGCVIYFSGTATGSAFVSAWTASSEL